MDILYIVSGIVIGIIFLAAANMLSVYVAKLVMMLIKTMKK